MIYRARQITNWNSCLLIEIQDCPWHECWIQCRMLGREFPVLTPTTELLYYIRDQVRNFYLHFWENDVPSYRLIQAFNREDAVVAAREVCRQNNWQFGAVCENRRQEDGTSCSYCTTMFPRVTFSVYDDNGEHRTVHRYW